MGVRTTYAVQWQMTWRNGWSFYSNWGTLEAAKNSMTAAEKVPGVTALRLLERKETISVLEKRKTEEAT